MCGAFSRECHFVSGDQCRQSRVGGRCDNAECRGEYPFGVGARLDGRAGPQAGLLLPGEQQHDQRWSPVRFVLRLARLLLRVQRRPSRRSPLRPDGAVDADGHRRQGHLGRSDQQYSGLASEAFVSFLFYFGQTTMCLPDSSHAHLVEAI